MKRAKRKKSARKKAARKPAKRASKKPASRRAGARAAKSARKRPVKRHKKPMPRKKTIHLVDPTGPDAAPHLSVSRKDQVRWQNKSSQTRTLTFTVWIFTQAESSITIKPKKFSRWFTIAPGTPYPATYPYAIDPEFPGAEGTPPDPPEVSADG